MKKYAKVAPASLSQPETKEGEMEDVDDNKSEASSALSDVKEEESEEVISSKHAARMARQSKFIAHRNQVRDAILKDVMAAILPDAGAYDLDGMVKAKARTKDTKLVAFLKMIGLVDLDLHESVIAGYEGKVKKAVNKLMKGKNANPALINQYNGDGRTPLIVACMLTSSKSVNILVDNHALVDVCEETTGRTPLMYSVMGRALDISNKLLSHKASVDMADFKCITPLMIACSKNDLKHVKLLCSHWADVDLQDENGWTALHYAVQGDAPKCIDFLLGEGADRSIRDVNKRRPLDFAKFLDHGECIALLSSASKVAL